MAMDIVPSEKQSKFYHETELIVTYSVYLNTLLQLDISEPICYGKLVYELKIIIESRIFLINSKYNTNVNK